MTELDTLDPLPTNESQYVPRGRFTAWAALAMVVAGVSLMLYLAHIESQSQKTQVWRNALVVLEGQPFWDDAIPARFRLTREETAPFYPLIQELQKQPKGVEAIDSLHLDMREYIVAVDMPGSEWTSLLESGRVPEPGKPEALAGPHCRFDHFTLDGVEFTVVGRLQRGTAGLSFAYLVPYSGHVMPLFEESRGATTGWIEKDTSRRPPMVEEQLDESMKVLLGTAPASTAVSRGVMLGLLLVVFGGAVFQVRVLRWLFRRKRLFATLLDSTNSSPFLFRAVHLLCYGALLGPMVLAFAFPLAHRLAILLVQETFTTGELAYVGTAYMSGNVATAAVATFVNNYIVQTLGITIVPSLVIPFWGLVKTMLNLAIAGFALAPLYTDFAWRYAFHSITVSLEVEAYVIAAYATCLYVIRVYKGITVGAFVKEATSASKLMLEAVLLTGVLLFIAATYEAATLILAG